MRLHFNVRTKLKTIIILLPFIAFSISSRAEESKIVEAVRAADDARVEAMIAVDTWKLVETLSDQLHYAHSVKFIESKSEHIATLVSKNLIYQSVDYKSRDFSVVAPGVVVMKGRAIVNVGSKRMIFEVDINFLGVWRLENEYWRLYAWQSSRNVDIVPLGPIEQ